MSDIDDQLKDLGKRWPVTREQYAALEAERNDLKELNQKNYDSFIWAAQERDQLRERVRELEKICKDKDSHRDHLLTNAGIMRAKAEGLVGALQLILVSARHKLSNEGHEQVAREALAAWKEEK